MIFLSDQYTCCLTFSDKWNNLWWRTDIRQKVYQYELIETWVFLNTCLNPYVLTLVLIFILAKFRASHKIIRIKQTL
jgi:hypothetical protein